MKKFLIIVLTFLLLLNNTFVIAYEATKYPDYAYEYLGEDKWENYNRKMFNFNQKLNKYAIRPMHILWSSIMPEYGIDRLNGIANNIEYPIRLISSLIQKDFKTSKNETIRFFTNTILGIGGMFDPAKHLFHIEQSKENMEQALAKCKVKQGGYFVLPVFSFTTGRGVLGKILDMAFNPSTYVGNPVLALVKFGLTVNRTTYMQPLLTMVESTYADPYEIMKKAFGIDNYIKQYNMDRVDVVSDLHKHTTDEDEIVTNTNKNKPAKYSQPENKDSIKQIVEIDVSSELLTPNLLYGGANLDKEIVDYNSDNFILESDIKLPGYNPQTPIVDSMRTALFALPGVDESIWNELSIWNRSFSRRIKTSSVNLTQERENYHFRYILQKDKTKSKLAIIFPSIGEGIMSTHSVTLAKLFYDEGYSVIILGSHFQWEFVKSMPKYYRPGLPAQDAEALRFAVSKIITQLQDKYKTEFNNKVIIGTSFGALTSLFVGAKEADNNTLGNTKIISICPPIDLIYAMKQVDKNSEEWNKAPEEFKQKVATTASKVVKLFQSKDDVNVEINNLPFSDEEGKIITGFIMHQKLSDVIFTIENTPQNNAGDIYKKINNMNYQDYVKKYLLTNEKDTCDDLSFETSLTSISKYLENSDNYRIYHSLNDYLTNSAQLKRLKDTTGNKTTLLDNGSHLGFLYRKEFINDLKNTISGLY